MKYFINTRNQRKLTCFIRLWKKNIMRAKKTIKYIRVYPDKSYKVYTIHHPMNFNEFLKLFLLHSSRISKNITNFLDFFIEI